MGGNECELAGYEPLEQTAGESTTSAVPAIEGRKGARPGAIADLAADSDGGAQHSEKRHGTEKESSHKDYSEKAGCKKDRREKARRKENRGKKISARRSGAENRLGRDNLR